MTYLLQYQAIADDLTSLAGSPGDTSWFLQRPATPFRLAPIPPPLGNFIVGDYESDAANPTDTSWLISFPAVSPLALEGPTLGLLAGDFTTGDAADPVDTSWLISFPAIAPLALQGPTLGFLAGDFTTDAANPADTSWLISFPAVAPLALEGPTLGLLVGDFTTADFVGVVWTSFGLPFRFDSAKWGSGSVFHLEGWMRQTTDEIKMRLYDDTLSAAVSNSEITTSNGSLTRVRSSALTLTDASSYRVQVGGTSGNGGDAGGKIIAVL